MFHGFGPLVPLRYYRELLSFCARMLRSRDAAADVVQESYARFFSAQQTGSVTEPRAMLYQTARHVMVDAHRRERIRDHDDLHALAEDAQPASPAHLQPDQALASAQQVRAYVAAIEGLPPRCREAFVLHVFDDLPYAQIAERMGTSVSMVEKHVARGRLACRATQIMAPRPGGHEGSAASCDYNDNTSPR